MKKTLLYLLFLSLYLNIYAQVQEGIEYQGIAKDNTGKKFVNKVIRLRLSILLINPTSTVVYCETQYPTTNQFGIFSVNIGTGTLVKGNFGKIDWTEGSYFIKAEMDTFGDNNFVFLDTSQLLYTPNTQKADRALKTLNDYDTSLVYINAKETKDTITATMGYGTSLDTINQTEFEKQQKAISDNAQWIQDGVKQNYVAPKKKGRSFKRVVHVVYMSSIVAFLITVCLQAAGVLD